MRACRFSSATSSSVPANRSGERPSVRVEDVRDRHDVDPTPEPSGALHRVLDALGRRVLRRHGEQADGLGTQRVGGERRDQRRVDPPGHPDHDLAEPVLAHVVAEAEHQRPVDLLRTGRPVGCAGRRRPVRRRRRPDRRRTTRSSSNIARARHDLAVGGDDHRAAVEHELVLAADGVHVDDPRAGLTRASAGDLQSLLALAVVIRRAVDVQDDPRTCARVLVERRVAVPRVLADREAELRRRQADRARGGPGHEVALLVEHAEVRELDLVIALLHAAVADQRGGVVQPQVRTVDEPDHHRARRPGGRRRPARRARPGCPRRTPGEGPGPRADSR